MHSKRRKNITTIISIVRWIETWGSYEGETKQKPTVHSISESHTHKWNPFLDNNGTNKKEKYYSYEITNWTLSTSHMQKLWGRLLPLKIKSSHFLIQVGYNNRLT